MDNLSKPAFKQQTSFFLTACTAGLTMRFGMVHQGVMYPNRPGVLVRQAWFQAGDEWKGITLHKQDFVVMPNHVHGIIHAAQSENGTTPEAKARTFAGCFLSGAASAFNALNRTRGRPLWAAVHVLFSIKDPGELSGLQQYIAENPARWTQDCYYPHRCRDPVTTR